MGDHGLRNQAEVEWDDNDKENCIFFLSVYLCVYVDRKGQEL